MRSVLRNASPSVVLLALLTACSTPPDQEAIDKVVSKVTLIPGPRGVVQLDATPVAGGWAVTVCGEETATFWVKDDVVYTGNSVAEAMAPELPEAPAHVVLPMADSDIPNIAAAADTMRNAAKLSGSEAKELEKTLEANPEDYHARAVLMAYYEKEAFSSNDARAYHSRHVLWFIEHAPDRPEAGAHTMWMDPVLNSAYDEAAALWKRQIAANPDSVAIQGNVASFFMIHEPDAARACYDRCIALEPNNATWQQKAGFLLDLERSSLKTEDAHKNASDALAHYQSAYALMGDEEEARYSLLADMAMAAFHAGELTTAVTYADELLAMATDKDHWNYGNAVHDGNVIHGLVALKQEDIAQAKRRLLAAGKSPGSPQLDSFGPDLILAKAFFERGERQTVIDYLRLIDRFWESEAPARWASMIENGGTPNFDDPYGMLDDLPGFLRALMP